MPEEDWCVNVGTFTYPPPPQFIIISSLLKVPQLTLFDYTYPDWSITVGYLIGFSSFMWIPIYMVYKLVWTPGSPKQVCVEIEEMIPEQVVILCFPPVFLFSSEAGRVSPAREDHPRNPRRQPPHDYHGMKTPLPDSEHLTLAVRKMCVGDLLPVLCGLD